MPLPLAKKGEYYIRMRRIFTDSLDRNRGTVSDYVINLKSHIQDVIGLELTGYVIPSSLTPTFRTDYNDKFQFELSTGGTTKTFTVTWPTNSYTYQNVSVPYVSYINTLEQLLQSAVLTDATFGTSGTNPAAFKVLADPEEKTVVTVSGTGITGFRFLFGSGANADLLTYLVMGFAQGVDTTSSLTQTSPNRVILEPFRKLEIYIDEIPELNPFHVIYNDNAAYYGTVGNEVNYTRTRFLSSNALKRLTKLTIRLRIDGLPIEDVYKNNHTFSFTVFQLAYEQTIPNWLKQYITL